MNVAYNIDCMEYMKTVPDKYFDLAVVDPPYGGGADVDAFENEEKGAHFVGRGRGKRYADMLSEKVILTTEGLTAPEIKAERRECGWNKYDVKVHRSCNPGGDHKTYAGNDIRHWDIAPPPEYFKELARVSKNQIIWGGNYFALPPTRCFLVWEKLTISENFTMAMAEYAWTSFNDNAKIFKCAPQGDGKMARIHPTQKPVELYKWIFDRYAKKGDKILDTHLGSGSSRIAAFYAGLDFVGCEISKVYYDMAEKRFKERTAQMGLFEGDI